ncbi:MAG TPA: NAD(P)-dependent oxidoreductase [Candidatus Acidoferrales bacterium]|nr:NAD(P)-dependent oxidoreductase [Candidatus Acidoferrales bacterium]
MRTPFYPVSLNLVGRKCVVIGASSDREAIDKAAALEESGADLHWVTDVGGFADSDIVDAFFVISTPQDASLSARLRKLADEHGFLLCCIDQPDYGFVAMAAIAKAGPVRVAISTTGLAPRVGKILKESLQRAMDSRFARFVDVLARKREDVKALHPSPEESSIRRQAMIEAAEGFAADVRFSYPQWFDKDA